ncbi:RNA methyltransferase [Gracilibacillus caseinilyticus]|uniref:RNA methyltransferase n=1 Tax=Gracilibacillus caseinilyticus TaxID=2932256 RepID=A0ABY4ES61_9BACI|nr:RNA methyltransferase [Gracilibacillus caseinilyticus]UOQ47190.1 RNA methyltransferase [Gracilibacillus caseinilyticus]
MLTSVKNEKVKSWRKLKKKKERDSEGKFLIEGYHLIEEAMKSEWNIEEIIYQTGSDVEGGWKHFPLHEVTDNVMMAITETKNPQGVLAVIHKKEGSNANISRALLIDRVQDPGNVGTMIRTADAAGFDTVILGEGTADLYNDKVIRATQGSLFHMEIYQANLNDTMNELKQHGITVWSTGLSNADYYHDLAIPDKLAIIVGNEGEGVAAEIMAQADQNVKIPIYGKAESLNVSIAAAVLMYATAKKV